MGQNKPTRKTAGFSLWFHLPAFHLRIFDPQPVQLARRGLKTPSSQSSSALGLQTRRRGLDGDPQPSWRVGVCCHGNSGPLDQCHPLPTFATGLMTIPARICCDHGYMSPSNNSPQAETRIKLAERRSFQPKEGMCQTRRH